MQLSDLIPTFNKAMQKKHGCKIVKLSINTDGTCPNRDGSKSTGGCIFCNNSSFSPREDMDIPKQIELGKEGVHVGKNQKVKYVAYFQSYTSTYTDIDILKKQIDISLSQTDIVGVIVSTRPDCLPDSILDLLENYKDKGLEVWIEIGLQTHDNKILQEINRQHTFEDYIEVVGRIQKRNIQLCTHLVAGFMNESKDSMLTSLKKVLELGVQGVKFHPLLVVKDTKLEQIWREGNYTPLEIEEYASVVAKCIEIIPESVCIHRITGTAKGDTLLAPLWSKRRIRVFRTITAILQGNS